MPTAAETAAAEQQSHLRMMEAQFKQGIFMFVTCALGLCWMAWRKPAQAYALLFGTWPRVAVTFVAPAIFYLVFTVIPARLKVRTKGCARQDREGEVRCACIGSKLRQNHSRRSSRL